MLPLAKRGVVILLWFWPERPEFIMGGARHLYISTGLGVAKAIALFYFRGGSILGRVLSVSVFGV
jgi:hypothetical protein